jgi:hypothetical protein
MKVKEYKTIKLGNLAKSFSVDQNSIDVENRRAKFALSSEEPYERFFGIEILGHNQDEVDLSRLRTGAPWLAEHDPIKQIGVIEEVSLDLDKVLRVTVRFSKNPLATEYFNDIVDGIRTKVSIGYQILEMEKVGEQRNQETGEVIDIYRVTRWMPYEGSNVSIPADNSVGLGRNQDNKQEKELTIFVKSMDEDCDDELSETPADEDAEQEDRSEVNSNESEVVNNDDKENNEKKFDINIITSDNNTNNKKNKDNNNNMDKELFELGRKFGNLELAVKFFEDGKSAAEFKDALLDLRASKATPTAHTSADAGESAEKRKFNFSGYLEEKLEGRSGNHTAFARELANGKEGANGGLILPRSVLLDVMKREYIQSASGVASMSPNTFRPEAIDALWNNSVVLGSINVYPSGTGNQSIEYPIIDGKHTFDYVGENGVAATSNATAKPIKFTPKYFSGRTTISRKTLKESAIVNNPWVLGQMLKAWDEYRDNILLNGVGGDGKITGLTKVTGVNAITTGGQPLDFKKVVELETAINFLNANQGQGVYLGNSKVAGYLKTTPQMNNSIALPIMVNNQVNGMAFKTSNQIDSDTLMLVNGQHVHYMEWDGYEVITLPKDGGMTQIELFAQFDMQVSHPEGISICKDIVL